MTARLVIAAPRSGEGKTSVTLGIASALVRRGVRVALAKVGPDYLDTGWHSLACGRPARNLDLWTMGEEGVRRGFARAAEAADVVLVEGVMGLFDGHRTDAADCSTAAVAKLLDAPVVLVVDASRAGASLAALAHGFARYDERVPVAGVVLNRWGAHRQRLAVEAAFARVELPVLGWLPPADDVALPSRHLGLVQSLEDEAAGRDTIAALGALVEEHADVAALLEIARGAGEEPQRVEDAEAVAHAGALPRPDRSPMSNGEQLFRRTHSTQHGRPPRLAVARDEAFAFYYADNLEMLAEAGAELVEFSPLEDAAVPQGVDGIYLGGGYPELHAERLAINASMQASITEAATTGLPIYAECGGMLYLLDSLADGEGRPYAMCGVLRGSAAMSGRLQRVGYVEATLASDCILGAGGTRVRGHEFRYSTCETAGAVDLARESTGLVDPAWIGSAGIAFGFRKGNVVASYLHLNFAGCPDVALSFVEACARGSRQGSNVNGGIR